MSTSSLGHYSLVVQEFWFISAIRPFRVESLSAGRVFRGRPSFPCTFFLWLPCLFWLLGGLLSHRRPWGLGSGRVGSWYVLDICQYILLGSCCWLGFPNRTYIFYALHLRWDAFCQFCILWCWFFEHAALCGIFGFWVIFLAHMVNKTRQYQSGFIFWLFSKL